jgi:hypothetical protein
LDEPTVAKEYGNKTGASKIKRQPANFSCIKTERCPGKKLAAKETNPTAKTIGCRWDSPSQFPAAI